MWVLLPLILKADRHCGDHQRKQAAPDRRRRSHATGPAQRLARESQSPSPARAVMRRDDDISRCILTPIILTVASELVPGRIAWLHDQAWQESYRLLRGFDVEVALRMRRV